MSFYNIKLYFLVFFPRYSVTLQLNLVSFRAFSNDFICIPCFVETLISDRGDLCNQRCIQNSVKHLRWNFSQKCFQPLTISQKAPSWMLNYVLHTALTMLQKCVTKASLESCLTFTSNIKRV